MVFIKRISVNILVVLLFFCLSNCTVPKNELCDEELKKMSNCTLLVNNKNITNKSYAIIDCQNMNTDIPLLLIIQELGGKVFWKNESIVCIKYNGEQIEIDVTKKDFGIPIPPGTKQAIRKITNGEIRIDSVSVRGFFRNIMNATIDVDYNTLVISIVSMGNN